MPISVKEQEKKQQEKKEQQQEVAPVNPSKDNEDIKPRKEQQVLSSLLRYCKSRPDPELVWEPHQNKQLMSEFQELIENRFKEVKRSSSIYKYNAKIGFQAFIYLLNILELIFTLSYGSYNEITNDNTYYETCYNLSIILCVLLHSGTWMYTYKFREVVRESFFVQIAYYIFYLIMGVLSYFKLAPFIYYMNRDQSIRQFSFSEINKYLQLSGEDKFRNPCRLFKERTKPVNIFRDLIFHRVALVSMIITMTIQTIPQLFIQGFYNTQKESWDGFNVFSYLFLMSNLIYYLLELQFIVFTTTYRQMQTELQFKLQKILLYSIQETKQLFKSDLNYMGFVKSFYFHIDPSAFSPYQKKRCMIQILYFLMKQKKVKNIEFHYIDLYHEVTLQYLANCFQLIKVESINLLYSNDNNLAQINRIFRGINNLKIEKQTSSNLNTKWEADNIDLNASDEKINEIQFIENPKINTGWQAVQKNQFIKDDYIQLSAEYQALIPNDLRRSLNVNRGISGLIVNQLSRIEDNQQNLLVQIETNEQIIIDAKNQIDSITKRDLYAQSVGNIQFLLKLYDYYEVWSKLNQYQATIQTFWSVLNGSLQIVSLIYLNNEPNMFISALIALTAINPILQMLSFAVFQQRVFKNFSPLRQLSYILLFAIFNFLKIWDIVMICLFLAVKRFSEDVKRNFSGQGYLKFKSYASKFSGSIATSVFQNETVQTDPNDIKQIQNQPFYEAVMWRTNVEEALNKIPQFFVYILSLASTQLDGIWVFSFGQQIKEGIFAVKDLLEVVIKDYFIPALILSTVSVDQFFQSMLYLSSISNQILLEYPKSFQIVSKVKQQYLKEKFTFKINVKTLNFTNYGDLKKQKLLAQFRYVLASINTILEIDQAQRLFCMGAELNDLIRCLKESPLYQIKLNYYLDEVKPEHIPYINAFIKNCPKNLQFLQIQVESSNVQQMEVYVERNNILTAFSYSYFQIIQQYKDKSVVVQQQTLIIDEKFLKLDRYNFEQFYFEVSGNLNLRNCHKLFENFDKLQVFKVSIFNNAEIQTFEFSQNLRSRALNILDITCENIILSFKQYPFNNLTQFKMILKRCEFNKEELKRILQGLNNKTEVVYIDMSQCLQRFTVTEQKDLVRGLEIKKIDAFIKI
ncbi:unnamed protein product [Paramecium primaurelia]|uniref:Transmembrane protein n=1 Tax=Paramecium primaurelia TaxID=5886 RepID=A0A8S1PYA7_PARPR|nr:unnamed protein product [Paramecium primaurelia]